jgi:diguanylate cyclase (GGDEF)-like protein
MSLYEDSIPQKTRLFFTTVIASGLALLVFSIFSAIVHKDPTWLILASLSLVSGLEFPVRLPFLREKRTSLTITIGDMFVFVAILLYSPEVAVVISVIDGLSANLKLAKAKQLYRILYNLSQLTVSTFLVGHLFYWLQGAHPPLDPATTEVHFWLFLNLGLCALLHFLFNSGSVALAVSLETGKTARKVFKDNLLWASITSVAGAAAAAIIFLTFTDTPVFAVVVTVPIILLIFLAFKMNLNRVRQAQHHLEKMDQLYHSTITSLAMAIGAKNQHTQGQIQRAQGLALGLAKRIGITDSHFVQGLKAAASLYDIGKLAIPEYILNKPGKLSESEMEKVRIHPSVGADILETVNFPYPVVSFVRHHHESWDGAGYPDGLKGDEIPLGARILAVVDCYVSLLSDRPYRPKMNRDLALALLIQEAGRTYDPKLVRILTSNIEDLEAEIDDVEELVPPALAGNIDNAPQTPPVQRRGIEQTVFHSIASTQREIQAVYEISQAIGKSLNVAETMNLLSGRIKRFVPYAACSIYLVNSEDDRVLPHHVVGMFRDILEGVEIKLGEGVSGWVAANNKPLRNVAPAPDFPNLEQLKETFKSCLAVPLAIDQRVVGVMTLYSDHAEPYLDHHLKLMEATAPHSASAINNAIVHEAARQDAYKDPLTELPNIRYLNVFVEEELKRARMMGYPVTLLMMDLEKFKRVNDRYGHAKGDLVLLTAAHLLRSQLRKSDVCSRYGGDEFLAVLPGVDKDLAEQTKQRVQSAFDDNPITHIEGDPVQVGISVGFALFPEDGLEADVLIAVADRDMYENKLEREGQEESSADLIRFQRRQE